MAFADLVGVASPAAAVGKSLRDFIPAYSYRYAAKYLVSPFPLPFCLFFSFHLPAVDYAAIISLAFSFLSPSLSYTPLPLPLPLTPFVKFY